MAAARIQVLKMYCLAVKPLHTSLPSLSILCSEGVKLLCESGQPTQSMYDLGAVYSFKYL